MYVLYEQVDISNIFLYFAVGRPEPEYGLPVAVYKKVRVNLTDFHAWLWVDQGQNKIHPWWLLENKTSEHPQQSLPPMGNRNRPIGLSNSSGPGPLPVWGGAA